MRFQDGTETPETERKARSPSDVEEPLESPKIERKSDFDESPNIKKKPTENNNVTAPPLSPVSLKSSGDLSPTSVCDVNDAKENRSDLSPGSKPLKNNNLEASISRNPSGVSHTDDSNVSEHGANEDEDQLSDLPSIPRSPANVGDSMTTNPPSHVTNNHIKSNSKNNFSLSVSNTESNSKSPANDQVTALHLNGLPIDSNKKATNQSNGTKQLSNEPFASTNNKSQIRVDNADQISLPKTPSSVSLKQDLDELSAIQALDDVLKSPVAYETPTTPIRDFSDLPAIIVHQESKKNPGPLRKSSNNESPSSEPTTNGDLPSPVTKDKPLNGNNTLSDSSQVIGPLLCLCLLPRIRLFVIVVRNDNVCFGQNALKLTLIIS